MNFRRLPLFASLLLACAFVVPAHAQRVSTADRLTALEQQLSAMRSGNQSTHTAPRNVYRCADGKYVAMSGSMQSMAERILRTIGRPELIDDPRFRTNTDRMKNREALDAIIETFVGTRSQAENLALFEAAQVTVGPVCSAADLLEHPYPAGREAIVEVDDPDQVCQRGLGFGIDFVDIYENWELASRTRRAVVSHRTAF